MKIKISSSSNSTLLEYIQQKAGSLAYTVVQDEADVVVTDNLDEIEEIKSSSPRIPVVGVQYFSSGTLIGAMLDSSYNSLLKHRTVLMVGCLNGMAGDPDKLLILTGERGIQPLQGLRNFDQHFFPLLASRVGNHHYHTDLRIIETFPISLTDAQHYTKLWAGWSLFPAYQNENPQYPGAEFGFVATRTDGGTLITARGSNKNNPTEKDFALIKAIDNNTLRVSSTGGKASLNAPLAHHIFSERPEIKWVVHSHIFVPEGTQAARISAPGTIEDWQAIEQAVKSGVKVINQPMHGTLILLEDPKELLPLLKRNGLYATNSQLYDTAYARFQSSATRKTSLERAVEALQLPADAKLLDLCCGTGASTLALQALGFTNIDIADGSASMLAIAEQRTGKKGKVTKLETLEGIEAEYDLITVRQAINYVAAEDVVRMAEAVASKLKIGGRFVFNTFVPLPSRSKGRDDAFETATQLIRTHEENQVIPERVLHAQRSEIINFEKECWHAVHDVNDFEQRSRHFLENALKAAGFDVAVNVEGPSVAFTATLRERNRKIEIPEPKNQILLVVSGSVAAIKTIELLDHLKTQGIAAQVITTDSARAYGFVNPDEVRVTSGKTALEPGAIDKAIAGAELILASPAAAGFISQIANQTTAIGKAIYGAPVPKVIAPAMNLMMWQHPATQRNVEKLLAQGWYITGPVEGLMACKEFGYGRMLGTEKIAHSVRSVLDGIAADAALDLYKLALIPSPKLPQTIDVSAKENKRVLLIMHSGNTEEARKLVDALQAKGCTVTCALSAEAAKSIDIDLIRKSTGRTVYTKHFEDDPRGMEHINLSRQHDVVLIAPASRKFVHEMAIGAATDLVSDTYLATNKPVLVVASQEEPARADMHRIAQDGVTVLTIDRSRGQSAANVAEQVNALLELQRRK